MFKVLYAAIRTFLYIEYMLFFSEMWQKVDTPIPILVKSWHPTLL